MMNTLLRQHFKRDGAAKRGYPSKMAALAGGVGDWVAYQCDICGLYHRAKS